MNNHKFIICKSPRLRKGVGTILAGCFIILIIMSGYTLTTVLNRRTKEFNEALWNMGIFDWERGRERVEIIGNPFNVNDKLNVTVRNMGDIGIHLNWLSVRNASTLKPILNYSPINSYIKPGETVAGIGEEVEDEFQGGFAGESMYVIQVWTDRGTVATLRHPPLEKEYTPVTNKIYSGPFEFSQEEDSFMYTSKDMDGGIDSEPPYIDNPTEPKPAYRLLDSFDHIIYSVKLKNVENRTVEIHASTFLLIIVPQISGTGESELYNYIVAPESNSVNITRYNHTGHDYTQSIQPGETGTLKFGSLGSRSVQFMYNNSLRGFQWNEKGSENLLTTHLVIFWRFQGTDEKFGQTMSIASIHLEKY